MSSSKRDGSASRSKPPSAAKSSTQTPTKMKDSKSDNSGLASVKKQALAGQGPDSPLNKNFLSKSQDNLTSHQKLTRTSALEKRPSSSLGLPEAKKRNTSNKENVQYKDKDGFAKPRPVKQSSTGTPIRKASSSQHIDKTGTAHTNKTPTKLSANMKRAHSTQNVSKEKSVKNRKSATPDVMAYNAELLANFEKERKIMEAKVSEQIQVNENRKMEIEKYKYEIRQLKEQIPSHNLLEELDIYRSQNALMKEQLMKLGVEAQITDSEKLSLIKHNMEAESALKASTSYDSLSTDGHAISLVQGMLLGPGNLCIFYYFLFLLLNK